MKRLAEYRISFANETLVLTNQRVLSWPRKKILVLSDLHLGKAAHFRKNGIPMPAGVSLHDLERLEQLLEHYHPEQVILVGDMIHAGTNKEVELFAAFTRNFPRILFLLIEGNHDRLPEIQLKALGIHAIHAEWETDAIRFVHQPPRPFTTPVQHTISGHIHPGVRVQLPTNQNLRLPCFCVTDKQLILPAFSTFTGLDTSFLSEETVCYALHEQGIFKIDNDHSYKK